MCTSLLYLNDHVHLIIIFVEICKIDVQHLINNNNNIKYTMRILFLLFVIWNVSISLSFIRFTVKN